jgi:RNA polymerase sigma-70 factor (ECF subfamily)
MTTQGRRLLFEHIYNLFWRELYMVAYRRIGDRMEVEDMLQDVFLSIFTSEVVLDDDQKIRAYLHKRLRSRILNYIRDKMIREEHHEHLAITSNFLGKNSDAKLLMHELENLFQNEIDRMPQRMRDIFMLSREKMLSTNEIAEKLNLSNQTVRNQISSAIKRVKKVHDEYNKTHFSNISIETFISIASLCLVLN